MGRTLSDEFVRFGSRSGLVAPMGQAAQALDRHAAMMDRDPTPRGPGNPNDRLAELAQRQDLVSQTRQIIGKRLDQPGGVGVRMEWGLINATTDAYGFRAYDGLGHAWVPVWTPG